jgi:hypothetical protein
VGPKDDVGDKGDKGDDFDYVNNKLKKNEKLKKFDVRFVNNITSTTLTPSKYFLNFDSKCFRKEQ